MVLSRPVYVTHKGLDELEEELEFLTQVKRPEITERLHDAKGGGDWKDSSENMLIEEELIFVDGRIQELQNMLHDAQLIEADQDASIINIGDTVVIQASNNEPEQYSIVGVAEADPANGLISNESPLGRALLGHKLGDQVIVTAPIGDIHYRIVSHT
jgi:transcription elongation factor GreA